MYGKRKRLAAQAELEAARVAAEEARLAEWREDLRARYAAENRRTQAAFDTRGLPRKGAVA